jgi:hypothetical protein
VLIFTFSVCIANYSPGKSVAIVSHILFYLIARGDRVILQEPSGARIGILFDNDKGGIQEISQNEGLRYVDDRPCWLLVSADADLSPIPELQFCKKIIVVSSPNMVKKKSLKDWMKQSRAKTFISPPPSCLEVVFLL